MPKMGGYHRTAHPRSQEQSEASPRSLRLPREFSHAEQLQGTASVPHTGDLPSLDAFPPASAQRPQVPAPRAVAAPATAEPAGAEEPAAAQPPGPDAKGWPAPPSPRGSSAPGHTGEVRWGLRFLLVRCASLYPVGSKRWQGAGAPRAVSGDPSHGHGACPRDARAGLSLSPRLPTLHQSLITRAGRCAGAELLRQPAPCPCPCPSGAPD